MTLPLKFPNNVINVHGSDFCGYCNNQQLCFFFNALQNLDGFEVICNRVYMYESFRSLFNGQAPFFLDTERKVLKNNNIFCS